MLTAIASAPRIGVSPVSCFELALAHRRGRLELPLAMREGFALALAGSDVVLLPFTPEIAARAVELPDMHRDPFDRIIIGTALAMDARLASVDGRFVSYTALAGRLIA